MNGYSGGKNVMSKFANVVTIEVAPAQRDQVVTLLLAHKARLKDEPGTLQFEVLLPKDAAAFACERAISRAIEERDCRNGGEAPWGAVRGRGLAAVTKSRQSDNRRPQEHRREYPGLR
jgi:hypothetical protein